MGLRTATWFAIPIIVTLLACQGRAFAIDLEKIPRRLGKEPIYKEATLFLFDHRLANADVAAELGL